MKTPALPLDETARKAALDALCLLDTAADERFDGITRLTQQRFGVPIVLVSLVDTNRQWFKSRQGLDALETPRDISFCGHAILQGESLVVEDASEDERFHDNPLVTGELNLRFYAGRPLESPDGQRVGTLCIIDTIPRSFGAADARDLDIFAKLVEREFLVDALHRQMDVTREHERRFRTLASHAPIGIFETDIAGACLYTNPAWQQITGLTNAEALGRGWSHAIHAHDRELVSADWQASARTSTRITLEFRFQRPSGEVRWVRSHAHPVCDHSGARTGWIGTTEDITDTRRAQAALAESEERFRQLADHVEAVFWITDVVTHDVLYVNAAFEHIWGRTAAAIYKNPLDWIESIHPEDRTAALAAFEEAITNEAGFEAEFRIVRPDGAIRHILDRGFPVKDATGNVYRLAGIAYDVTDQRLAAQQLEKLARTDSLTGLANRRQFDENLEQEIARAKRHGTPLTLALIDIDHFKQINDTLGHGQGDQTLQTIAARIRDGLRITDVAGRLGGDELAALLPNTDAVAARAVLTRILESIRHSLDAGQGRVLTVSCSIGAACWREHTAHALLHDADAALYRAKNLGRDQVVVEADDEEAHGSADERYVANG